MSKIKGVHSARYSSWFLLTCLWLFSGIPVTVAQSNGQSTRPDASILRAQAAIVRSDYRRAEDQDLGLIRAQDSAMISGDTIRAANIKAQRAAFRAQYEHSLQQSIDTGHAYLAKKGIARRYRTRNAQAASYEALGFADFLESVARSGK